MRCSVLAVALCLLAPATASARKAEDTFFNSVIPIRVDHLIGFTPTTFAIHPRPTRWLQRSSSSRGNPLG